VPVKVGDARVAFVPTRLVIVVEKLGASPKAVANSFNVSNVAPAPLIRFPISVLTKAVVAICVEFVTDSAVGAKGAPVKVGLAKSLFRANAAKVKVLMGLLSSETLSILLIEEPIVSNCV
jgi:hypothetical protein